MQTKVINCNSAKKLSLTSCAHKSYRSFDAILRFVELKLKFEMERISFVRHKNHMDISLFEKNSFEPLTLFQSFWTYEFSKINFQTEKLAISADDISSSILLKFYSTIFILWWVLEPQFLPSSAQLQSQLQISFSLTGLRLVLFLLNPATRPTSHPPRNIDGKKENKLIS